MRACSFPEALAYRQVLGEVVKPPLDKEMTKDRVRYVSAGSSTANPDAHPGRSRALHWADQAQPLGE